MASELEGYTEAFGKMVQPESPLYHAQQVTRIIADSKTGLGEVIHDYAKQSYRQINEIITAIHNIANNVATPEDTKLLVNAGYVLKIVAKFLEIVPAAMKRNHTREIGADRHLFTLSQIETIQQNFIHSPDIQKLFALEMVPPVFSDTGT